MRFPRLMFNKYKLRVRLSTIIKLELNMKVFIFWNLLGVFNELEGDLISFNRYGNNVQYHLGRAPIYKHQQYI